MQQKGDAVHVQVPLRKTDRQGRSHFPNGYGFHRHCRWMTAPAQFKQKRNHVSVEAVLPPGTTAWFVNLHCGDLIASSDFFETRKP